MWKTLTRPAMIFVPFLLGAFCPQAHVLNDPPLNIVRWALCIMIFMSCLQLEFRDLKPRKEHWFLLAANLLMGVIPYFLLKKLLPDSPDLALAAFFVGITPTATAAPVVISFLHGRLGFALTGFTITNLFVSLSLIGLLPMVTGTFTLGFITRVVITLLQIIALPFTCAMLARRVWPGIRALPKRCKTFSFSLWSFTLFVLAATARQYFIENPHVSLLQIGAVGLISLTICFCDFYFGKLLASRRYRRECSQLLGQKNTTFTLYLALQYANPFVAMGPIFYILWHNLWNAWQMFRYDVHRATRPNRIHPERLKSEQKSEPETGKD